MTSADITEYTGGYTEVNTEAYSDGHAGINTGINTGGFIRVNTRAFTHLHVHTEYSLLDGSAKIKELVARVKELGMDSIAITDHGVMYGVIDFYRECRENNIRPIIGCEVYVAPNSRFDREPNAGGDRYYHLVLLAENNTGYQNLTKIVSKGFTEGFYYRPRIDCDTLREYSGGLIALSACLAGEIPNLIRKNMYDEAVKAAKKYEDIFGKGNFFLELQDHGIDEQKNVNMALMRMSMELGIELVATNDTHYIYAEDAVAHDVLLCIQTNKKVRDEDRMRYEGGQFYVKSEQEMRTLFPYALQAVENTHKIAQRCNVEIEFGVTKIPKYDVPSGYGSWEYLTGLCLDGIEKRYGNSLTGEIRDRLDYELSVIKKMGYVDYFLIVWDFINYARNNGITVGPGRGSAAGSIAAYALGITDIDPIRYNLLFERFLNPERVSMPDIDIDFCFERRQEVIDYVVNKYGSKRVAQIITFGTMAAKGVIRDVGRALDMPYAQVDTIAKMIPNALNMTIDMALDLNPELRSVYETNDEIKSLIDMSKKLEGLPRHTSMHAAGVLISPEDVDEFVPLSRSSDGTITTQYVMTTLEELGLLKMDFLGLRTLTVIQNAAQLASKKAGQPLDMDAIDYNDKKVLEYIGSGRTEGVFQLESAGMKSFMKELKPGNLEDIIAGIALYRPGPMDFIPKYIKGKENKEYITYDCPQLEPILKPTYGCIVYQEQVMQIVRDLAGYTLGRSDILRRAMSKKKASVMEKERRNFVYGNPDESVPGCIKNGISEEVANHIYDEMIDFAKYAFNKSHAAAYAVVSYRTAYLKYYWPLEFMAALTNSVIDNAAKVAEYITTIRSMGINVLPPDINEGESGFTVSGQAIRYGLSALKSVGKSVIDAVINERRSNGIFVSIKDFIDRMSGTEVNKRTIESFIKAGAFDGFGANRNRLMNVYVQILEAAGREKKDMIPGQLNLFEFAPEEDKRNFEIKMPDLPEFPKSVLLAMEKEVIGVYVSGHPLDEYRAKLKRCVDATAADFVADEDGKFAVEDGAMATVGGMIAGITVKSTRNNKMMAFITLEDISGNIEIILFPGEYEKFRKYIREDNKIIVRGKVSLGDDGLGKMICGDIKLFSDIPSKLWIKFKNSLEYERRREELADMLKFSDGKDSVVIYLEQERVKKQLPQSMSVNADEELISALSGVYGKDNVKLT